MFGILIIELIKCRIFMMILLRVLLLFIKKKNIIVPIVESLGIHLKNVKNQLQVSELFVLS